MDLAQRCPCCRQPDTLIPLGVRYDHPHRWRPWTIRLTQLYLCEHCEALLVVEPPHAPGMIRARTTRSGMARTVPHGCIWERVTVYGHASGLSGRVVSRRR